MPKQLNKIIFIILILSISFLTYNFHQINTLKDNTEVLYQESLIEKQSKISKEILNNLDFSKPQIILDPYDIAPLSALLIFETENLETPTVSILNKNKEVDITNEFKAATKHFLPIYGLYPNYNNEVIVELENETLSFNIQTAPLPKDFPTLAKKPYINQEYLDVLGDDFYFLTPAANGYTCAYDKEGEVRFYLTENLVWEIKYLKNNNLILSNERLINPPYYTTGLYEMSLLGKIEREYVLEGGYHHDVYELENSNLIVASNNFDDNTVEDYIVEIDRKSGEIVKTIDLKEILNPNTGKSENWVAFDWFHNNSVFFDENSNSLILSGRHQDSVISIDYDTLKINYIVGDNTNYDASYQKYFLTPTNELEWPYSQHAAKIYDGKLFVFDNGNNRSKDPENYVAAKDNYSRGVVYDIDTNKMEITQLFEYGKERGSDYYSSYISDIDYLDNDHYLIHSGGVAYLNNEILNQPPGLNEADKLLSYTSEVYNNNLIFELAINSNFYRAEKMPLYNSNLHHNFDNANSLGQLSKTKTSKNKFTPFMAFKNNQKILDNYKIEITKEFDRLVVKGNFNKDDDVSIILYQNFNSLYYDLRISERPYTAMCIVVFDNKKQQVIKYINDSEELVGEYAVLIKINDTIYNTNYKINY